MYYSLRKAIIVARRIKNKMGNVPHVGYFAMSFAFSAAGENERKKDEE